MMTKIFFLINHDAILIQETPLPVQELLDSIRAGRTQDLQPLNHLLSQKPPDEELQFIPLGSRGLVIMPAAILRSADPQNGVSLSPRQRQVLDCLAQGLTSKQIAAHLGLSRRTVNLHIAAIKNKLHTETNAQSVGRATALGYCRPRMRRREG